MLFFKKSLVVLSLVVLAVMTFVVSAEARGTRKTPSRSTRSRPKQPSYGSFLIRVGVECDPRVEKTAITYSTQDWVSGPTTSDFYPALFSGAFIVGKEYGVNIQLFDQLGDIIGGTEFKFTQTRRTMVIHVDPTINPPVKVEEPEPQPTPEQAWPKFKLVGHDPWIIGYRLDFAPDGDFVVVDTTGNSITLYNRDRIGISRVENLSVNDVTVDNDKVIWGAYNPFGLARLYWGSQVWSFIPFTTAAGSDVAVDAQEVILINPTRVIRTDRFTGEVVSSSGFPLDGDFLFRIALAGTSFKDYGAFVATRNGNIGYITAEPTEFGKIKWIAQIPEAHDPRGLVYLPYRNRLFVLGEGKLFIMTPHDATTVAVTVEVSAVGIGYNPVNDMIYTIGWNGLSWFRP